MREDAFAGFKNLDRDALVRQMAEALPQIRRRFDISQEELAEKTGVDAAKIKAAEKGRRDLKWSEFMSILFVIWNNDIGKGMLDEEGLFPEELKRALSVNRNAHAPVTEASSGRWEF